MSSHRSLFAPLFAVSVLLVMLASGCGADRFNDSGCISDQECRAGRICSEGMCMDPGEADQPNEDEPDAGPDEDTDVAPDAVEAFLGRWEMTVSGTITQEGQVDEVDEEETVIEISRGSDSDLIIGMVAEEGFCPIQANLTAEDSFVLLDEGCTMAQEGATFTYQNIEGRGSLDEGVLSFTYLADVEAEVDEGPMMQASFDIIFADGRRL